MVMKDTKDKNNDYTTSHQYKRKHSGFVTISKQNIIGFCQETQANEPEYFLTRKSYF